MALINQQQWLTTRPQWTARMYPGKTGRDHLGLGSVSSDQILPSLSPAINVLTVHPRYYSFYVFLLDEFWKRDFPRTQAAWAAYFRPREYIFSVGAYLPGHTEDTPTHANMGNIVGGRNTGPAALEQRAVYSPYRGAEDYIVSTLGGYGLYYRTVMAELGLIYPGGQGLPYPVDVPSELGKEVAAAFREAVANTAYYRRYFPDDDVEIPRAVIREYIDRACLCQLQHEDAPDRPLVLDLFLHGGTVETASARRATFRLFLDLAGQTQGYAIDQDRFRQLLYFQATGDGATYRPREAVKETYRRWRLYQAREYYAFALDALWDYLCTWGLSHHGDIRPLPLAAFWEHLEVALDFDGLAAIFQLPPPGLSASSDWQRLLGWLAMVARSNTHTLDAPYRRDVPLQEHALYEGARAHRTDTRFMLAGMVIMLALVYQRFDHDPLHELDTWSISRMGDNGRLPVDRYLHSLRSRLEGGQTTIIGLLRWLYRDYIILQHQIIATGKLPDNTFRFRREGDRLHFYPHSNRLDFMDSRYDALSTMVHELGLCGNLYHEEHPLTPDGRQLLEEGDLTWMS